MKKFIYVFFMLVLSFSLVSCRSDNKKDEKKVENISILEKTVPNEIDVKELDTKLTSIKLLVEYDDDSLEKVSISKSMISEDDYDKLKKAGTYEIVVTYFNLETSLNLTIIDSEANTLVDARNDAIDKTINASKIVSWTQDEMNNVTTDLNLVNQIGDIIVTWESSHEDIIFNGKVTRPIFQHRDAKYIDPNDHSKGKYVEVKLTAVFTHIYTYLEDGNEKQGIANYINIYSFKVICLDENSIVDFDPNQTIEIEFWHAMGQANQEIIEEIIYNFNLIYPNISVRQTSLGTYDTLRDTIASSVAVGDLPTLAQAYPDHIALYLSGNAVQPLDQYINSNKEYVLYDGSTDIVGLTKEEQDMFIPGFFNEGKVFDEKQTLYSLPFNKSTEVMYYNKTIFDKYGWTAPKTWDDVVTISEAYKTTSEYQALIKAGKQTTAFSADSEANLFITLTEQWGGKVTELDEYGNGVYAFNNAKSKEALQFFKDQYKAGNFATTTHFGANYSSDAFTAGNIIMTIGSSAGASYNVPKNGAFEVGVCAYPQKDMSNPQVIQQGTNVTLFDNADPYEELAGWLFMKYLTNYESALLWALETNYLPIRTDVLNSNEYTDHIAGIIRDGEGNEFVRPSASQLAQQVALKQQNWYFTNVVFPGSSLVRGEAESIVQAILYQGKTVERAYQDAINNLLYY